MLCNYDESWVVANFRVWNGNKFDCEILTISCEIDELSREPTQMWQTLGKYNKLEFFGFEHGYFVKGL